MGMARGNAGSRRQTGGVARHVRSPRFVWPVGSLLALLLAVSSVWTSAGALGLAGADAVDARVVRSGTTSSAGTPAEPTGTDRPIQADQPSEGSGDGEGEGAGGGGQGTDPGADPVSQPPTVEVACDSWDACNLVADRAYFRAAIELQICIEADTLNMQESTACGIDLATLAQKVRGRERTQSGTLAFDGWECDTTDAGRIRCSGSITLLEGSFGTCPMVQAVDEQGAEAAFNALEEQQVHHLVVDGSAPRVAISGAAEGAQLRLPATVVVEVCDERWDEVIDFDGRQVLVEVRRDGSLVQEVCAASEGVNVVDGRCSYRIPIPARPSGEDDGTYAIEARAIDLAGNASEHEVRTVVVDTIAPKLQVDISAPEPCAEVADGPLYRSPVSARIVLWERNLDPEDLNGTPSPVRLDVRATRGGTARMVEVGAWEREEDHFVRHMCLASDGTYGFELRGADKAGNPLAGTASTPVGEDGSYASPPFVIDLTDPTISVSCDPAADAQPQLAGRPCYARPVCVEVVVRDRNFDPTRSTVSNSLGDDVIVEWGELGDENGVVSYVARLAYCEEATGIGAGIKHVVALARDVAGHEALATTDFVVDQTAPVVSSAAMSKRPIIFWSAVPGAAPWYFYNEQDGMPTTITLAVSDEYGLADAWVDDPDGAYSGKVGRVRNKTRETIALRLKDHVAHDARHDTAFEQNIRVFVRDLAGNVRVWTLGGATEVRADRKDGAGSVSLDGEGVFPQALVNDVVAPRVSLSGVTAGAYYAQDQQVLVSVEEDGLAWLARLDPGRVVATVARRAGSADGERTSWNIPVSALLGNAPYYAFVQPLADDGHYVVTAQLTDASGNVSEPVMTGEFTIDKTAPVVTVEWDNDDVRNGKYYRAHRTATITVAEHNFSEQGMTVRTTGSVGGWVSEGDVHRCIVSFATDATAEAPHRLSVEGVDLAGNACTPYKSPDFVIDTQPPVVSITKVTSTNDALVADSAETELRDRSAFAQACRPIVRCGDEANLDLTLTTATLRCEHRRSGNGDLQATTVPGVDELEFDWGNLGVDERTGAGYGMDGDGIYTLTAQSVDLAGNESAKRTVTFSLNRFGSTFFCEKGDGARAEAGEVWQGELLTAPPRIVVHEINVCDQASDEDSGDSHLVTKEHAFSTTAIEQTDREARTGYTIAHANDGQDEGNPEGWQEYVYTIAPGNFGKGSDSDYGDGGQGLYSVDVSSTDAAGNRNTTTAFWAAGEDVDAQPVPQSSTASFVLDEEGPTIEDVVLPDSLCAGGSCEVSFYVRDEVGKGDTVSAWVDGRRVDVYRDDSDEPVGPNLLQEQGSFRLRVDPMPVWVPRHLRIVVGDYTGTEERACGYEADGFLCTTGWVEAGVAVGGVVAVIGFTRLVHGALARRGKGGGHGRTD